MTFLIRFLWLVLAGVWLAIAYALAGLLAGLATAGAPVAGASLRMSAYALWPFGRRLTGRPAASGLVPDSPHGGVTGTVWLVVAAWWLALVHLVVGVVLCLTVIGLPFGVAALTLLPVALGPLGAEVLPAPRPRTVTILARPEPSSLLAAA